MRFIVAAPGGSSLDIIARSVGEKLKERLGQPVVVKNIPGASGTIIYPKGRPGQLNYTSVGNGSSSHLTMELFKTMAMVMPHLKSGKVRALAVASAARFPLRPGLPTVAEARKWSEIIRRTGAKLDETWRKAKSLL